MTTGVTGVAYRGFDFVGIEGCESKQQYKTDQDAHDQYHEAQQREFESAVAPYRSHQLPQHDGER